MTTPAPRAPRFLMVSEVAAQLHVSTKTVRRRIARGELRVHQIGRQHRIAEDDFTLFLAKARK